MLKIYEHDKIKNMLEAEKGEELLFQTMNGVTKHCFTNICQCNIAYSVNVVHVQFCFKSFSFIIVVIIMLLSYRPG